jgi:hypothetical protein
MKSLTLNLAALSFSVNVLLTTSQSLWLWYLWPFLRGTITEAGASLEANQCRRRLLLKPAIVKAG